MSAILFDGVAKAWHVCPTMRTIDKRIKMCDAIVLDTLIAASYQPHDCAGACRLHNIKETT
eukprot:scaffold11087_cov65-Skeletonema_dohrnii-CCMP3373.AAC.1